MSTETKTALILMVKTGACSFVDASRHALDLTKTVEFVELSHNGVTIEVCPDWTVKDCEVAWSYAMMVQRGLPLEWRQLRSRGHRYSPPDVARAMHASEAFHQDVLGRVAHLRTQDDG